MDQENLQILQELYPKYNIKYNIKGDILCSYKYFTSFMSSNPDEHKSTIRDIYDSIDYVMQFLLENGFERLNLQSNIYFNVYFKIYVKISHWSYFIYGYDNYREYSIDDFIREVKHLLGIKTQFKKVLNE